MTARRSLRFNVLLGAVLWTAGLVAITDIIATLFIHRAPGLLRLAHGSMLALVAVACMAAGLSQVRRGLSPLGQLRARLSAMRDGRDRRVEGQYPEEVQPLVDDLNALLEGRERMVARALATAGDLAHGLKTPLAVLAREAERAEAEGHLDLADTIGQQVERMRRQADYHLARARAAAGAASGARCLVHDSAEGLARALERLHAGRGLGLDQRVAPTHAVRCQREGLDEMLGNLLDNACQWAKSRVVISSSLDDGAVLITVDDDGPGLDPSLRDGVLRRGVRADEAAGGSGFGLAIVRELAELHGGSIALDRSAAGGLRAELRLPAA